MEQVDLIVDLRNFIPVKIRIITGRVYVCEFHNDVQKIIFLN